MYIQRSKLSHTRAAVVCTLGEQMLQHKFSGELGRLWAFTIPDFPGTVAFRLRRRVSSSPNVNSDLKQPELWQMQKCVLEGEGRGGGLSEEGEKQMERSDRHGGGLPETLLRRPLKQTPATEVEAPGKHQRSCQAVSSQLQMRRWEPELIRISD